MEHTKKPIPDTIARTLVVLSEQKWFPNIRVILCLIAVVPSSSNSCERSISKLRMIKTYLRSTIGQDRFSSLALVNIHSEIDIDFQKVLDIFATDYQHRLLLKDILDTEDK